MTVKTATVEKLDPETYFNYGIEVRSTEPCGELRVEVSQPRAIPIQAVNGLTGEVKTYMLRVTHKGGLCLL
jgi:hypothetical protein